ncbi:hypothetical protein FU659_28930 [Paenibacillus sp. N3.4]|nr:hypothetical protein FU659_28930 [Paenibacillus sp. N3.4]
MAWDTDPIKFPCNTWLQDLIVHFGSIEGKQLTGEAWTVLVSITGLIEGMWDTFADVRFLVDDAPWQDLVCGYTFRLWAGREVATVKIL